ncbi:MAG TPA: VWA domain-containing protein [Terracidiphilus sp.]|jgi:VWFA-related protein
MGHTRSIRTGVFLLVVGLVFAGSVAHAQCERHGCRIRLDVVVTDASGKPVSGLQANDFKILDEGAERKFTSFAAFDGVNAKPDPPTQVILVIDSVNNGFVEMGYIRQGAEKYLRQNEGRLAEPTSIVRFVPSGVQFLSQPSRDGIALAEAVDQIGASTRPRGLDDFSLSMHALSAIANKEVKVPGRKLLIWLGPGWQTPGPVRGTFTKVDERNQRAYFQVMVQMARVLHQGRMVLYGGYSAADFYMRDFLKPVRKLSEVDPRMLSLGVLAAKSGGRGELTPINRDSAVTDAMNHFVGEASVYYTLMFDAPQAKQKDEFHSLNVVVDRPGMTARTVAGYYDEPRDFQTGAAPLEDTITIQMPGIDEPGAAEQPVEEPHAPRLVTVAQFKDAIESVIGKRDGEAAKEIEHLQLTERLSTTEMLALSNGLPGTKTKSALMVVGDSSVFLEPAEAETPGKPVPDMNEQKKMMSRVVEYLKEMIPKLPDFYARRSTSSFEQIWTPKDEKGSHRRAVMHSAGQFNATVYNRGGEEVVHHNGAREHGLVTRGTFGPVLTTVILDAARSKTTQWSRWEEGPNGAMAVFRFKVAQEESHYAVSGSPFEAIGPTAYHGEIGIDPDSGTILRLVLEADPVLGSSMERADIMVEYGEVSIGGKPYTCPVRSVSFSIGTLVAPSEFGVFKQEAARLNDVLFSNYHVFRSEIKIIP